MEQSPRPAESSEAHVGHVLSTLAQTLKVPIGPEEIIFGWQDPDFPEDPHRKVQASLQQDYTGHYILVARKFRATENSIETLDEWCVTFSSFGKLNFVGHLTDFLGDSSSEEAQQKRQQLLEGNVNKPEGEVLHVFGTYFDMAIISGLKA